jgi:nicotinamide-nucleotide amidase
MNAIILSIGDELVLGQTVDTNSAWLSQRLAGAGCAVLAHVTVGDDQAAIEAAIRQAAGRCDVLLVTGGLGPTADDLTRQAIAAVLGVELELSQPWVEQLREFFRQRQRPMPQANTIQAMIPRGARMIWNHNGTAAGIHARLSAGEPGRPTELFAMPGVPGEMFAMFDRDVMGRLLARAGSAVILSRALHTFGLGESAIAQLLGDLMRRDRNPLVGTTVSGGIVSLRINARFDPRQEAEKQLAATEQLCRQALGDLIYGADDQTLAQAVAHLLTGNQQRATTNVLSVTTAESCTGGLLAKYLTDVPGSSSYFRRGWVTYANEAKTELLGVAADLLARHGAVSEPVVRAMAQGALARAGAAYALAISGIAGPDGGTPDKPVGTVWIAVAGPSSPDDVTARRFVMPGDRQMIRDRAVKMALTLLRFRLLGKPTPF